MSGKYITNANTDDRLRSDALEVLARALDENPDIALVYADFFVTQTENQTFDKPNPVGIYRGIDFDREILFDFCFVGPQPMWRREVHEEYGYFDEAFVSAGDYEFWLRISQTHKFQRVDEILGLYLESPDSLEHSNASQGMQETLAARARYRPQIKPVVHEKVPQRTPNGLERGLHAIVQMREQSCEQYWPSLSKYTDRALDITLLPGVRDADGKLRQIEKQLAVTWQISSSDETLVQAINRAINNDEHEAVIVLSSDTILTAGWLDRMLHIIRQDHNVAMVGPMSNAAPTPQAIKVAYRGQGKALQKFARRMARKYEQQIVETQYLGAFCLLMNIQVCRQVGQLRDDLDFPNALWEYYERLRAAGYKLIVAKDVYVHHQVLDEEEGATYDELAAAEGAIHAKLDKVQTALKDNDLETALQAYSELAEDVPGLAAAHTGLGMVWLALGKPEPAVTSLQRAIELAPGDVALHNQLGVALYQSGQAEAAAEAFQQALQVEANNLDALLNLADLCRAQDDYAQGSVYIRRAVEVAPQC